MSCDPKSVEFARHILDAALSAELKYEQLFEALLLAYSSVAKNYPPGLDAPVNSMTRCVNELRGQQDLAQVTAAQANQLQIVFH